MKLDKKTVSALSAAILSIVFSGCSQEKIDEITIESRSDVFLLTSTKVSTNENSIFIKEICIGKQLYIFADGYNAGGLEKAEESTRCLLTK